jgi:uncharacterized damage-inducible protein DinB
MPISEAANREQQKQMSIGSALLQELEQEATTTRRVLERVPDAQLTWKPHAKSWSLGQLALHIATVPGGVASLVTAPSVHAPTFDQPAATRAAELLPALDKSIAQAKQVLQGLDDASMTATFRIMVGDREVMALPRVAFLRSIMLNHWYHHRGQLSVYLRELNVPVPSIYGPSADESPFADMS